MRGSTGIAAGSALPWGDGSRPWGAGVLRAPLPYTWQGPLPGLALSPASSPYWGQTCAPLPSVPSANQDLLLDPVHFCQIFLPATALRRNSDASGNPGEEAEVPGAASGSWAAQALWGGIRSLPKLEATEKVTVQCNSDSGFRRTHVYGRCSVMVLSPWGSP